VRLVAATHVDLLEAVRAGRFREDLYYRINVYPIRIPPLRERTQDIEVFARHLLQRFCSKHDKHVSGFTDEALLALREHAWPGNVREMENLIERGVILAGVGQLIEARHLFAQPADGASHTLEDSGRLRSNDTQVVEGKLLDQLLNRRIGLQRLERELIEEAVARNKGNLAAAARLLGLTRPQLSYRLAKIRAS